MILIYRRIALPLTQVIAAELGIRDCRWTHGCDDRLELVVGHRGASLVQFDDFLQLVEGVRCNLYNLDFELFAHGHHILVADPSEWLRVLLEGETRGMPFLKELRQSVCGLAANHE